MSDRSDLANVLHEIEVANERLRGSLLLDLPPESRRDIADKAIAIMQPLWQRLADACEHEIIEARAANTHTQGRDLATRTEGEREIFSKILLASLTGARTLSEAQHIAESIQQGGGLTTAMLPPTGKAAIDAGLQAFSLGKTLQALQTWAMADDPVTVVGDVQAQRQKLAAELIEQANMACDVIKDLDNSRLRYQARDTVMQKALGPIERIGTEKQRDQALWVRDELDVLVEQSPARQRAANVAAVVPTKGARRSWFGIVAAVVGVLAVALVAWFVFGWVGSGNQTGVAVQPPAETNVALVATIPPEAPPTRVPETTTDPAVLVTTEATSPPEPSAAEQATELATEAATEAATVAPEVATVAPEAPTAAPAETSAPPAETSAPATIVAAESATAAPVESAQALPPEAVTGTAAESATAVPVTTAEPDAAPLPGRIAYVSQRDRNQDIYVRDAVGGEPFNVTNHPERDFSPAWSPDGTQIVFVSDRTGTEQLFLINTDGSNLRQLTNESGRKATPAWSPDGANIVFQRDEEIFLSRVSSGTLIRLTNNDIVDTTPAWSSDGQRVIYSSFRTDDFEIFFTDATGNAFTQLTTNPGSDRFAICAPDGSAIAFISNRNGRQQIFLMNTDGTNQRPLDIQLPQIRRISWSPDSKYLVFDAYDSSISNIYAVGVDGTGLRQLTENSFDLEPAWGP